MKLAKYIQLSGLTQEQFAVQIDRSAATVSRIANGVVKPDWGTAAIIKRVTQGAVTADDFLDDDEVSDAV